MSTNNVGFSSQHAKMFYGLLNCMSRFNKEEFFAIEENRMVIILRQFLKESVILENLQRLNHTIATYSGQIIHEVSRPFFNDCSHFRNCLITINKIDAVIPQLINEVNYHENLEEIKAVQMCLKQLTELKERIYIMLYGFFEDKSKALERSKKNASDKQRTIDVISAANVDLMSEISKMTIKNLALLDASRKNVALLDAQDRTRTYTSYDTRT